MSVTIEIVYEKLMQLTELCDREFKEIHRRLGNVETRLARVERVMGVMASDIGELRVRFQDLEADRPLRDA